MKENTKYIRISNLHMIGAMSKNTGGIGNNNELLYFLKEDIEFFKDKTLNNVVVMGSNTYKSLKNGALKNRLNIVLTTKKDTFFERSGVTGQEIRQENVILMASIEEVLEYTKSTTKEVYIIGGSFVYNTFLQYAKDIYLTEIYEKKIKTYDCKFPIFTDMIESREILKTYKDDKNNNILKFDIVHYILKE